MKNDHPPLMKEPVAHNPAFAKKVGVPKSVGEDFSQADKGKKFSKGGNMAAKETMGPRTMSKDVEKGSNKDIKHGEHAIQKRGHTRAMEPKMKNDGLNDIGTIGMKKGGKTVKKMASGGTASARADGIAQKGKTRGKIC